jgi:hypothetical protein
MISCNIIGCNEKTYHNLEEHSLYFNIVLPSMPVSATGLSAKICMCFSSPMLRYPPNSYSLFGSTDNRWRV